MAEAQLSASETRPTTQEDPPPSTQGEHVAQKKAGRASSVKSTSSTKSTGTTKSKTSTTKAAPRKQTGQTTTAASRATQKRGKQDGEAARKTPAVSAPAVSEPRSLLDRYQVNSATGAALHAQAPKDWGGYRIPRRQEKSDARRHYHERRARRKQRSRSRSKDRGRARRRRNKYHDISSSEASDSETQSDTGSSTDEYEYSDITDSSPTRGRHDRYSDEDDIVLPPAPIPVLLPGQKKPDVVPPQAMPQVVQQAPEPHDNQAEIDAILQQEGDPLLQEYMSQFRDTSVGPPLRSTQLADLAKTVWDRGELRPGSIRETMEKYHCPENLQNVVPTACNAEVYKSLPKSAKVMEGKLKSIQNTTVTAAHAVLEIRDALCTGQELDCREITDKAVDTLTILAATNRSVNQLRRDLIRPTLDFKYQSLCQRSSRPEEGSLLFGEDLMKKVKLSQETTYLTRKRSGRASFRPKKRFHHSYKKYGQYPRKRTRGEGPRRSGHGSGQYSQYNDNRAINGSLADFNTVALETELQCRSDMADTYLDSGNNSIDNTNDALLNCRTDACQEAEERPALDAVPWTGLPKTQHQDKPSLVSFYEPAFIRYIQHLEQMPFEAGGIANRLSAWKELTSDYTLLQTVKGMKIEFMDQPYQLRPKPQIKFSQKEHEVIRSEISSLLAKGVICKTVHVQGEIISNIFTREKKDSGKHRVILNLSDLNEQIEFIHFKMDTLQTALSLIMPNCYCASIDLSDAYYSVNIHDSFRKYLRFQYDDQLYEFTCLPNGLSPGPRMFTKLLKPVFSKLRKCHGITVMGYLDDLLLVDSDEEALCEAVKITVELFTNLGFKISFKKSQLVPSQHVEFLGFDIRSDTMSVHLPEKKAQKIISQCQKFQ